MDLTVSSMSNAAPMLDLARAASDTRSPAVGFMTTLESTLADPAAAATEAEALVGTRIEAPPGGCGCDALVATVTPSTTNSAAVRAAAAAQADRPIDVVLTRGSTVDVAANGLTFQPIGDRTDVQRGDLLELLGEGRSHLAIARGLGEMIRVSSIGIVEITEIPWSLVEGRATSPR